MYDKLLYDKMSTDRDEIQAMTTNVLRLTEHPPLRRDQAFDRLRDAIITGHFAPGARLIERELCEAMGVSRTSIREVLRRLEAEQLIEVEPRRGPVVARLTRKQVAEIYEVRALLETAVVRRFALEASNEAISELRRIYEELSVARRREDVSAIVNTTRQFSEHMMRVVNHELINDIHQKLIARISVSRVLAISLPGRLEQSARELAIVMDAIERRDAELAHQGAFRARVRQRFHQQKCVGFTALASRKIGAYARIDPGRWCRRPSRKTDAMDLDWLNVQLAARGIIGWRFRASLRRRERPGRRFRRDHRRLGTLMWNCIAGRPALGGEDHPILRLFVRLDCAAGATLSFRRCTGGIRRLTVRLSS